MAEMYTSPERVERDGWLVAFEGEVMSMDEAVKRGLVSDDPEPEQEPESELVPETEPEQKPKRGTGRKASK